MGRSVLEVSKYVAIPFCRIISWYLLNTSLECRLLCRDGSLPQLKMTFSLCLFNLQWIGDLACQSSYSNITVPNVVWDTLSLRQWHPSAVEYFREPMKLITLKLKSFIACSLKLMVKFDEGHVGVMLVSCPVALQHLRRSEARSGRSNAKVCCGHSGSSCPKLPDERHMLLWIKLNKIPRD